MWVTSGQVPVLLDGQEDFGTWSLDTWREGNVIVLYLLEDEMPSRQGLTQKLMATCICPFVQDIVLVCEKVRIRAGGKAWCLRGSSFSSNKDIASGTSGW